MNTYIIQIVKSELEENKISAEKYLQLEKICEIENKFTKCLSPKQKEIYNQLEIEKSIYQDLELDDAIKLTYKISKELFLQ